jgi:hypothetical protein
MNSIESRIYSDAAQAAAEITPADIPPLRLPAHRGRLPRRRGASAGRSAFTGAVRSRGTRRRLAPLAAAASVAVIIAIMITLGRTPGTGHRRPGPAARPTHQAHPLSGLRSALPAEALDSYFPATGAQYTDGLAYEWNRLKITTWTFGTCMADAGFPQPPFSEPESAYLDAFPDNSSFPDLAQRARTDSMGPQNYIAANPVAPKTAAGRAAVRRCNAVSAKPFPFAQTDKIALHLGGQWQGIIFSIQSSARVHATQPAFAACLEAHGIPAAYAQQQVNASNPLFDGYFAWTDHLSQTATSNSQLTAEDHRWTPVFVRCARPVVSLVERLQLVRRASFFRQHARQIREIMTLAADRVPVAGH